MSAQPQEFIPAGLSQALQLPADMVGAIRQSEGAMEIADAFEITDDEVATMAAQECTQIAQRIDQLKALRKKHFEPIDTMIANTKALFDPSIKRWTEARAKLLGRLTEWEDAKRRRIALENAKREEEARKARQEAEQKAAAERARAEQHAQEQRRIAQEAEARRAKAEAEGNARAAAAAAAEAAKAAQKAEDAIESGNAKAMEAQTQAAAQIAAAPAVTAQKTQGFTTSLDWVAELREGFTEDDAKLAICGAVDERRDLLAYLKLDMTAINRSAKAFKDKAAIPGFKVVSRSIARGKRK